MTTDRLPQAPARNTDDPLPPYLIADAVERVLARLKVVRPHLEGRLDRAATYLVVQLSTSARTRPIRVRVRKGGKRVMLVASLTSGGVTYEVDPASWSCSCPDHHRRAAPCKHSIAAWVLATASNTAPEPEPQDEPAGGLTHAQARRWLEAQRWHFAKTMPGNHHEYCLRREAEDEGMFEATVAHIREFGQPYPWWGTVYLQYVAGDHAHWTMGKRPQETILINRKTLERVRLDQLNNKGGGGIVWPWLHTDVEVERKELRRQESGQDEL